MTGLSHSQFVYQTLGQGISQINSSFNNVNYTSVSEAEDRGDSTFYQIVTTIRNGTSHSLFFNPDAAAEAEDHYSFDYIANTLSMTTQCTIATRECNLTALKPGPTQLDQNNLSIPFHCHNDFYGNLGQTPTTGHERAQGWNMSFYDMVDGSPRSIPVQAQSNSYNFYVAAAVNSVNLQDLDAPPNDTIVDAGGGFSAFPLNCEVNIYSVTFSLVNGSFLHLQHDESLASNGIYHQSPPPNRVWPISSLRSRSARCPS